MDAIRVVFAESHPIGDVGRQILASLRSLFEDLAPEAAMIEMTLSPEPRPRLRRRKQSPPPSPQVLILRDDSTRVYIFGIRTHLSATNLTEHEALQRILAALPLTADDGSEPPSQRIVAQLASQSLEAAATEPPDLTTREREVLQQLAIGKADRAIAEHLGIKLRTVRYHLQNIYTKLGVKQRSEAIVWAIRAGLMET